MPKKISTEMQDRLVALVDLADRVGVSFAHRYGRQHRDDFQGAARLGLSQAASSFQEGRVSRNGGPVEFESYARRCIYVACTDYGRSLSPKGFRYKSVLSRRKQGKPTSPVPSVRCFSDHSPRVLRECSVPTRATLLEKRELLDRCLKENPRAASSYAKNWVY